MSGSTMVTASSIIRPSDSAPSPSAQQRAAGLAFGAHRMELDPVDEGVFVDRPRVRERDELDGVDLDQAGPDPVAAAFLDLWSLPEADRQRDIAGQDVIAQLATELHPQDA